MKQKEENSKKSIENRVAKVELSPLPPTLIRLELSENFDALEELNTLIKNNHGRSEVELVITSKLVNINMKTYIKIDPIIREQIEAIEGIEVVG